MTDEMIFYFISFSSFPIPSFFGFLLGWAVVDKLKWCLDELELSLDSDPSSRRRRKIARSSQATASRWEAFCRIDIHSLILPACVLAAGILIPVAVWVPCA